MTQTWQRSDLNGYARGRREIAGEVRGTEGRVWIFFDGIEIHRVPMQFGQWNPATGVMTIPNWLAMRMYARAKRRIRNRYVPRQPSNPLEI